MAKQQLLLVDGDPRTLHALEASLRTAGFAVMTAGNGQAALARCRVSPPDLVVSDTAIPGMDGFQLCAALKSDDVLKDTPIVFLSGHGSVEEKVRGLELGAEDYLTKPIDPRELVTRVRVLVEKKERERLRRRQRASFSGSLTDLSMSDLLQTLEIGHKTATVHLEAADGRTATLWLHDGAVVDAETGHRRGEAAFHWFLKWRDGRFSIEFGPVARPVRIDVPTQHLLMEGMRRLDEWSHALEKLPPTDTVLQVDYLLLSERLADLPDRVNAILRLVDGRRSITQILEEAETDELEAITALHELLRDEVVRVRGRSGGEVPPALPSRAGAARVVGDEWLPTPVDAVGRGDRTERGPVDELPGSLDASPRASRGGEDAGGPSLASAVAAAARRAPRDGDPPPPRIVRFAAEPRMAVEVPPVAAARRRTGSSRGPPPLPGEVRAPALAPADVPAEERARRAGGKGAFLVLVLALALGFAAWRLAGRPATSPPAPTPRVDAGYGAALSDARREQASARFPEAAEAYRRALALRTTSEAYEGLGRALRDTGDVPAAVAALRRAIELDPGNAAAYIAIARIHAEARRPDEARSAYERYLALEPRGSDAEEARAALGATP